MAKFRGLGATLAVIGLSILVIGCGSRDTPAKPNPAPPDSDSGKRDPQPKVWAAEAAHLDQLAPAEDVAGYQFRPPKGFTLVKKKQGGTEAFIWQGTQRDDLSTPKIWVMVGTLGPGEEKLSLEEGAGLLHGGTKSKFEEYSETRPERGQIGGLTFLRFTFQGKEKGEMPIKGHAILYHAHDGQKYIHMIAMDSEPHHKKTLPMLEASARSFRKP